MIKNVKSVLKYISYLAQKVVGKVAWLAYNEHAMTCYDISL